MKARDQATRPNETAMHHSHIDWQTAFELGIEGIDFQHRYFVDLINRLSDDLESGNDQKYHAALLNELKAYARFHFVSEENLMMRCAYPGLDEHKRHHRELVDQMSARIAKLEISYSETSADAIIRFLIDWFSNHTVSEDRRFADWLQQGNPAQT